LDTDNQDRMVTRQARIDAFHEGVPPTDQSLELLCEDHIGTYVIPFLCRWRGGAWQSAETGKPIEATLVLDAVVGVFVWLTAR
jgi:hypothetical protein